MKTNKKQNTKDKLMVWSIGITILLVVSGLIIWGVVSIKQGNSKLGFAPMIIAAVILILGIIFIKRQYSSVKKGFPFEDERSKKVMVLAGYYAFLSSIWFFLILAWMSNDGAIGSFGFRDVSQAFGVGIFGMAIIFGICWMWVNKFANLDNPRIKI